MTKTNWQDLTAVDVMRTNVLTVSESTPLSEVERLLSTTDVLKALADSA